MTDTLVIIDMMYTIHRHIYAVRQQEQAMHRYALTNPYTGEESARLFYSLRDIEQILQKYPEADVVICSDRKSIRKEISSNEYKKNRGQGEGCIDDLDSRAIRNLEVLMETAGISVIYLDGLEADDLIYSVVTKFENKYNKIYIYTPDSDMSTLIDDKVTIMRYKSVYSQYGVDGNSSHVKFINAHAEVNKNNFEQYWTKEFSKKGNIVIDYNTILLYKSTVGDTSDSIPGISRFGNAAYMKLRATLIKNGFQSHFKELVSTEATRALLNNLSSYFTEEQFVQANNSLALAQHIFIDIPDKVLKQVPNLSNRIEVYSSTWGIRSV